MAGVIQNSNVNAIEASYDVLYKIQTSDNATQTTASLVTSGSKLYQVDLNTRTIEKPDDYIIVESDHVSETIYFKIPRYFDNMDITQTVCIIQYINANKEQYIYVVPYYDVDTLAAEHDLEIDSVGAYATKASQVIIPWRIAGTAAAKAGNVTFSMRFFQMAQYGREMYYNLNTLPQTLTVKEGIGINFQKVAQENEWVENLTNEVQESYEKYFANAAALASQGALYWNLV